MTAAGLRWDPGWVLVVDGPDSVTVSAGSDLTFQIDGLKPAVVSRAVGWVAGHQIEPEDHQEQGLADHLINIGAIRLDHDGLLVHVVGDGPLADALRPQFEAKRSEFTTPAHRAEGADGQPVVVKLVVLESPDSADRRQAIDGLHLFVDATTHHTLVIGPFVVPGFTACGGCWQRRFGRRWSPLVASEPHVAKNPTLVAELLAIQVDLIRRWSSPVINATIAWDLAQGTVQRDDLLRVPDCQNCHRLDHSSELALPYDTLAPIRRPVDG